MLWMLCACCIAGWDWVPSKYTADMDIAGWDWLPSKYTADMDIYYDAMMLFDTHVHIALVEIVSPKTSDVKITQP